MELRARKFGKVAKMARITENTTIGELLRSNPEAKDILQSMGMHCSSCPSAQRETLGQAAMVHGMDVDDLLEDLKGFLETMN